MVYHKRTIHSEQVDFVTVVHQDLNSYLYKEGRSKFTWLEVFAFPARFGVIILRRSKQHGKNEADVIKKMVVPSQSQT